MASGWSRLFLNLVFNSYTYVILVLRRFEASCMNSIFDIFKIRVRLCSVILLCHVLASSFIQWRRLTSAQHQNPLPQSTNSCPASRNPHQDIQITTTQNTKSQHHWKLHEPST